MNVNTDISHFLIKISIFSAILAGLAYGIVLMNWTLLSIKTILAIQGFVLLVTTLVHIFLMRSATAEIRIQKFMFNFMLTITLKLFIYCGAFVALIFLGRDLITEQFTNLSLFLVLFGYYMLYTVFEVSSILKYVRNIS